MLNILKKAVLFGVGAITLSKEKIEESVKKISKDLELSEKQGKELVKELLQESKNVKVSLENQMKEISSKALDKLDLVKKSDFTALQKKVEKLEKLLAKPAAKK